ncbi:MAG: hypothetical protein NTZ72_02990 [Afipia sp.]|nr:hypothetical protein [Afipia sp.]
MRNKGPTKFIKGTICAASAFGLLALWSSTASAASAPQQLYNKSITLSWGESGVYKRLSDGGSSSPIGQFQIIIYVSGAGRPFVRGSSKSGRFGGTKDRGPEENSGNVQFAGNTLVTVRENLGIARRIVTTFDGSFASCSSTVTIGKIGANATITGFDGAVHQVISMQPGAASCSISNGNALAN